MIEYLEGDDVVLPKSVTSANEPAGAEPAGWLTSTILRGEIFLHPKGDESTWFRLRWSADDTARARPLPPGRYVVTGYRQLAREEDGTPWIWSTSSVGYRQVEIKAGETLHLEARTSMAVKARAFFKRGKYRASLTFQAEKKLGNTLYRSGKRIVVHWQCLDAKGRVLDEGPMQYG